MALLNREKQMTVRQLPIGEIAPSPHQTRRDFKEEELTALAQSIDRSGLLNPISVRELPQGGYCLIAGERRWRACQMLGWSRIPALVWEKDEPDAAVLTLAETCTVPTCITSRKPRGSCGLSPGAASPRMRPPPCWR